MAGKAKRTLIFGDVHIPQQNRSSVEVFCRVAEYIQPHLIICLGDLLDCGQFSTHSPTYGAPETKYANDLQDANDLLDRLQDSCERLVMLEGNHEDRIGRFAAKTREGKAAYEMLAPHVQLRKSRSNFRYIQYGPVDDRLSYYSITPRTVAVHGWSYAKNATRIHLEKSQGRSVVHGHTHRIDYHPVQCRWSPGKNIRAIGAGCLCKLVPIWKAGAPVDWVNAFIVGYLGRTSETMYPVEIQSGKCVLPDGKEIKT